MRGTGLKRSPLAYSLFGRDGNRDNLSGQEGRARRNCDCPKRLNFLYQSSVCLLSLRLTSKIQFAYEPPVPSQADETRSSSQQDTQGIRKRQRALLIAFSLLITVSAVAWLAIPHFPLDYTCEFRDRPILRWLWPGNQAIYNDLILWQGAQNEECDLFSTESMLSVFCAAFSIFFCFDIESSAGYGATADFNYAAHSVDAYRPSVRWL